MSELGRLIGKVPDFRDLTAAERDEAAERFMVEALALPRYAERYPWALRVERLPNDHPAWMSPRAEWGEGPWQHEPDIVEWRRAGSGLPCLIVRAGTGSLCGYVGLPPVHPDFAKPYGSVEVEDAHGGLTFAGYCAGHICHVPREGETGIVWWLGFDSAHFGDYSPALEGLTRGLRARYADTYVAAGLDVERLGMQQFEQYKTLGYVKACVEAMADELGERGPENISRERWWWWHVAQAKQLFRQDLPDMWKRIFLEKTRFGMREDEWEQAPWNRSRGGK